MFTDLCLRGENMRGFVLLGLALLVGCGAAEPEQQPQEDPAAAAEQESWVIEGNE